MRSLPRHIARLHGSVVDDRVPRHIRLVRGPEPEGSETPGRAPPIASGSKAELRWCSELRDHAVTSHPAGAVSRRAFRARGVRPGAVIRRGPRRAYGRRTWP